MELYLLRHAIAVDREKWKDSDDTRPLTSDGRERMTEIVAGLKHLIPKLDLIMTSPLVRAWQTAEIVRKAYGIKIKDSHKFCETVALAPDSKFEPLIAELKQCSKDMRVLLVGHQPYLGDLISYLIADGFARCFPLKKGGAACLEADPEDLRSSTTLLWMAVPKQLRLIAKSK